MSARNRLIEDMLEALISAVEVIQEGNEVITNLAKNVQDRDEAVQPVTGNVSQAIDTTIAIGEAARLKRELEKAYDRIQTMEILLGEWITLMRSVRGDKWMSAVVDKPERDSIDVLLSETSGYLNGLPSKWKVQGPIPHSVYWCAEHDNFYNHRGEGLGSGFYTHWFPRAMEFPVWPNVVRPSEYTERLAGYKILVENVLDPLADLLSKVGDWFETASASSTGLHFTLANGSPQEVDKIKMRLLTWLADAEKFIGQRHRVVTRPKALGGCSSL